MRIAGRSRIASGLCMLVSSVGLATGSLARAQSTSPPPADAPRPATVTTESLPSPPPEPQSPPALDGPRSGVEVTAPGTSVRVRNSGTAPAGRAESVDVSAPGASVRVYVPQEPPPPVAERPTRERPHARAVWTPGYWEWDQDDARFVWVAGSWRVPPAGTVWVSGRWLHDTGGWYWSPGGWQAATARATVAANQPAWRRSGPPAEHPDDTPPPAPGPDSFYVPGHYAPTAAGDRLAWVPGFWSAMQPGWDWVPAHWIRRPDGWDFREGHWIRDGAPQPVVERVPNRLLRKARRNGTDVVVTTRDPVTGARVDVETAGEPVPVTGPSYYVIRPPGAYPYGPNGVVVPSTVPPFVRRILNNVLP